MRLTLIIILFLQSVPGASAALALPLIDSGAVLTTTGSESPGRSTAPAPVIDVHLHVGAGREGSPYYEVGPDETPDEAFQRAFLSDLDANGVVAGIVGGPAAYVERFRQLAPDRLVAAIAFPCTDGLDPNRQRCFGHGGDWPDLEWLRAEAEAGRIGALGELYNVYVGVPVDGPEMAPYLALAAELDLLVLAHADSGPPPEGRVPGCCPRFDGALGHPSHWEPVLERHRNLRLVLYHAFRPDWIETAIDLLDRYPNVMVETSPMTRVPTPLVHAALRTFVEAGHADRIVFGSDYPGAIGPSLEVIDGADFLSEAQKRAIRHDNAARLLGLTGTNPAEAGDARAWTIDVAPPMGDAAADRASVQAAFDAVRPGGTVRFAPGRYLLGSGARLTASDVVVLGHPEGTTLRGCAPEAFDVADDERERLVFGCTGLYLQGERQTVRGLTFEYTWHGIVIGPFPTTAEEAAIFWERAGSEPPAHPAGGHRIEDNTFRAAPNGLRVLGAGEELSIVRNNNFIDVYHAIGIYGAPLHFVDNRVLVEDPERVPLTRAPGSAVLVAPGDRACAGHVVAGNRIEGYPDPIYVYAEVGETCRGVEVRDNLIRAARVRIPGPGAFGEFSSEHDATLVGTPITVLGATPREGDEEPAGRLEAIVVEGNRIEGAEGLGMRIQGVTNSRIEGNIIQGVRARQPFPGNTWDGAEQTWEAANGSGIWLSSSSDDNVISDNAFEDIAAFSVFVEGDNNHVALIEAADTVRDVGHGNRIHTGRSPEKQPEKNQDAHETLR
ncbi:amidohydrolase family protein [Wenzhouxiangella sediminis]|uniref:Right handed beta helix domain-containing protein n=1 Tax=Wenzhouxiangella sediminis TaxID=1792836 RepID=A0A3E1KBB8_9GAMM|nr:amidohydrolase family protein [Wenzhouxiangella sediminis]RFF31770.1 hypothetical protein DZC52_03745 [Wenzhouxiangella sediminis]